MSDDSMIILHKCCQILINRPQKELLTSATALKTSIKNFSVSCEVLVYTDKIVSTEWRDLVPQDSELVIVPRFTFVLHSVFMSPISSVRGIEFSFGICRSEYECCFHFFNISTFEASPSESEFTLSEECASTLVQVLEIHCEEL